MEEDMISDLTAELIVELEIEEDEEEYAKSVKLLEIKLRNAIREVKRAISFPASYKEEQIYMELEKYLGNIKNLAMYDYAKVGAEGETAHTEKNITRQYQTRESCFNGIVRFAEV